MYKRQLAERTVLWQPLLGRGLAVHDETLQAIAKSELPPPLRRRLSSLGLLKDTIQDRAYAVIVRMRGVTALPQRHCLWHPLPNQPGPGGFAYGRTELTELGLAVWLAITDTKTVSDVADKLTVSCGDVLQILAEWMGPNVQAVQLRPAPLKRVDPTLLAPLSPPRPDLGRDRVGTGTDLLAYHQDAITDGSTHFDDRETTIAHSYAEPHPALHGERYGARLARVLGDVTPDMVLAEVGCGTGELARDLSSVVSAVYVRVDLSPELLRLGIAYLMQEQRLGGVSRSTRSLLRELAAQPKEGERKGPPPRKLTIGTRLVRDWHGVGHTVTVLQDGFEYNGKQWRSLTAIAKAISGSHYSGPRFFGLTGPTA